MATRRKDKTAYFCGQCGAMHPKWQGQCRECGVWNKLIEERVPEKKNKTTRSVPVTAVTIADIAPETITGFSSGISEFDRVLGGRVIPGMTVLLGGDPGIGKSTLMLQAAEAFGGQGMDVLYVTGEESLPQMKIRAERLGVVGDRITAVNISALDEIITVIDSGKYGVVCIDSIQTVASPQFDSPPGTVAQIRESANELITLAKANGFALFLVGHVTKDGMIAGPKVLEHMVDTVVSFEGDSTHLYRLLRVTKNRFGSVAEIGLFEMLSEGLVEVSNPSSFFLGDTTDTSRTGAVVAGVCEGNRQLLVEVQALVTSASYGNPQRVAGGIDNKKLALLLAILEKRCDYPISSHDVFVSVAGGLKLSEPALDLPVMVAITSSLLNKPVPAKTLVVGEVGLSGEVRGISMIDRRVGEAAKLGFDSVVLPETNLSLVTENGVDLIGVKDIQTALDRIFG